MSFEGRVALVTGGGSGLGRAIALALAKAGAQVVVAGRRRDRLEETAALAARAGSPGAVTARVSDVTVEAQRAQLVSDTVSATNRLDILVNSAGILESGSLEKTGLDDWDRSMDINLRSLFALTKLAAPHIIRAKGSILNLSSVAGLRPYPGLLAYCVSKAAVDQLTRCLALDLAPHGVRVNALNPGVVVTDLHRSGGMPEDSYKTFLERGKQTHPIGRVGQPEDVAQAAMFLLSNASGWITGTTLSVDGGRALASAR